MAAPLAAWSDKLNRVAVTPIDADQRFVEKTLPKLTLRKVLYTPLEPPIHQRNLERIRTLQTSANNRIVDLETEALGLMKFG